MSLSEELSRLDELHRKGSLSDDEYRRAKERSLGQGVAGVSAVNAFRRSRTDNWIAGVCGGLARSTGVDTWVWRVAMTLLLLLGGTGAVLYILLWIFAPSE